jgi:hypothetical protein
MISRVILAPRKAGDIVADPIRIAVPGVLSTRTFADDRCGTRMARPQGFVMTDPDLAVTGDKNKPRHGQNRNGRGSG